MAFGFLFSYIPSFPIPAAGREISVLREKVRSVWRRIELAEGKGRLLGTTGSPISIIPCLEKLDLQSKSIFWLNLCSNGKKTKNWASFEGLDTRCYQFLNCAGRIVCVERTGDLLSLPIFLLEFTFYLPFPSPGYRWDLSLWVTPLPCLQLLTAGPVLYSAYTSKLLLKNISQEIFFFLSFCF